MSNYITLSFAGAAPLSTSTIYKALLWFGSSLFEKEDADPSDDWEHMASKLTVRVQINIFSSHLSHERISLPSKKSPCQCSKLEHWCN